MPQLPPIPPPPPRWNQEQANWEIYQKTIEEWEAQYEPPNDIHQLEKDFAEAIHEAANKSMPKTKQGNHTFKDSWYFCPEVRRIKTCLSRVRKLYKKKDLL